MYKLEAKNSKALQRANRLHILDLIRKNPGIVRSAIIEQTGLSPASVSNNVNYLISCGLVQEAGAENVERAGRKGMRLCFDGSALRIITACLSGKTLCLYLSDLSGKAYARMESNADAPDAQSFETLLLTSIRSMLSLPQAKRVIGIGISMSALVLDGGRSIVSSALGCDNLNLPDLLKDTGIPVHVSNSSFTKAMWLCRDNSGWNRGLTLFVDLSGGMGAALIRNGQQMPEIIGEIGHTLVCTGEGSISHLEKMCSPERTSRECSLYLGMGLANLVNLFNPDTIVINNRDFADRPDVVKDAREIMQDKAIAALGKRAQFHITAFNSDHWAQAMACELCDALFSRQNETDMFDLVESPIFNNSKI